MPGTGYAGVDGYVGSLELPYDLAEDFHVYAVDRERELIAWSIDDTPFHHATPGDVAPAAWLFDQPLFLLLNLAVGGTFGGAVAAETVFPQSMHVDYMRVYA